MNGPRLWTGKDKNDMYQFMSAQIERYRIEIRQTQKALLDDPGIQELSISAIKQSLTFLPVK